MANMGLHWPIQASIDLDWLTLSYTGLKNVYYSSLRWLTLFYPSLNWLSLADTSFHWFTMAYTGKKKKDVCLHWLTMFYNVLTWLSLDYTVLQYIQAFTGLNWLTLSDTGLH